MGTLASHWKHPPLSLLLLAQALPASSLLRLHSRIAPGNAAQGLQRGRDLLLHLLLLACLWEVLLVYHSQEPLLKWLKC